jgi:sterol 24-C-methyltransferase
MPRVEHDFTAAEMFRLMKPGGRYSCIEYLLTPHFDKSDAEHVRLHKLFLPTLAATQSNYPKDVTDALERAGFKLILSAPSVAPAWPLTDQKTDLFLCIRWIVIQLHKIGVVPEWVETLVDNLLMGGRAWADAEKAKLADLNWQIIVEKPL